MDPHLHPQTSSASGDIASSVETEFVELWIVVGAFPCDTWQAEGTCVRL